MASPTITARDAVHFSLTVTAALPLFLWALLRTLDGRRLRDAVVTGVSVALAFYSDAYFGVFCALMGTVILVWRLTTIEWRSVRAPVRLARALDVWSGVTVAVILWRLWNGPATMSVGPMVIRLNTLHTPVLMLTAAMLARVWIVRRPVVSITPPSDGWRPMLRLGATAALSCLLVMLPSLVGLALRLASGRMPDQPRAWRSTPRGLDLLAYLVPNQTHANWGEVTQYWLMPPGADAFPEFVASFSLLAAILIVVAAWRRALPALQ